jgi:hypothetical protein
LVGQADMNSADTWCRSQDADVMALVLYHTPSFCIWHCSTSTMTVLPTPRLACEQCKRRKLRCNKTSPCAACKSAGLECRTVQRARLPRGKSGQTRNQNDKLENRVARIESLLSLQTRISCEPSSTPNTGLISASRVEMTDVFDGSKPAFLPDEKVTSLVGSEFWEALSMEVQGLRETLESEDDEDADAELEDAAGQVPPEIGITSAILFGPSSTKFDALHLSPGMRTTLLGFYRSRVDTVYKILHWPTTLLSIQARYMSSNDASFSLPSQALETAIYFTATCSLTNEEAKGNDLGDRLQLLDAFRSFVEHLFARSDLLRSPDLVLLQAVVIYLVIAKSFWTRCAIY